MPSYVIHRGKSAIDNVTDIVVIATVSAANRKTGDMLQTYILLEDRSPIDGVRTGEDSAICGGCIHRGDGKTGAGRTCYVNLAHGPRVVWAAYKAGDLPDYTNDPDAVRNLGHGRMVRLGTYGDPCAAPLALWQTLLAGAEGWTGYTHQWRAARFAPFKGLVMASCDTPEDMTKASAASWGTFTVVPHGETLPGAILCPASEEAGKVTQCAECRLCNGRSATAVYIPAHGASRKRYTGKRQPLPTV